MRRIILGAALALLANFLLSPIDATPNTAAALETKTIRTQPALAQINTAAQEFAPTFSPDGKTMVFSSTRGSKYSHLYLSRLVDGKWGAPEPLHSVNSQFNDETPFLSADGKILLFASDRDGSVEIPGAGQTRVSFDIYLAKWDGKTWANPQPVHEINTQWNEKSPALSRDGKYLFFSSWPFGEMKRSRIRMLDLNANGNTIEDLPPHINSGNQETALVPGEDDTRYYFSSRRPGGKGGWDIYQTRFENGVWADAEPVPGNVNTAGNEAFIAVAGGNYFISSTFTPEKQDYDLNIEPVPDLPIAKKPAEENIADLKNLKKNTSIDIRSIYFDFDSARLKQASTPTLNTILTFLKDNPKAEFEIIGHTDLNGDNDYNQTLSEQRAESVRTWLVERGVLEQRLTTSGAGKSKPIVAKRGKPYDEKNRRTEFKLKSEL
ncbi:MAG: PD40 domain-containing protein [Spirochaetes bacterium]|nr:PD40 domain-containing protein [Spirochaetota bacterium]